MKTTFFEQLSALHDDFRFYQESNWLNCLKLAEKLISNDKNDPDERAKYVYNLCGGLFEKSCLNIVDFLEIKRFTEGADHGV